MLPTSFHDSNTAMRRNIQINIACMYFNSTNEYILLGSEITYQTLTAILLTTWQRQKYPQVRLEEMLLPHVPES